MVDRLWLEKMYGQKAVNGVKTPVNHGDSHSCDDEKYFQTPLTCIAAG
jgi:hypothetical protein